ncbi:hypothetical protein H5U35_03360 [Candidatus Aerophobetes bacterium]|nr:hypothetical protein [Candidatus Aerophobetes bacterium]
MKKEESFAFYLVKIVEKGGCGAVLGAIAFTILAGFITDARPVFIMKYSPLIGGAIGVFIFLGISAILDFKKVREFEEKLKTLEGKEKINFLQEKIHSPLYSIQIKVKTELEKLKK